MSLARRESELGLARDSNWLFALTNHSEITHTVSTLAGSGEMGFSGCPDP